MAGSVPVTAVAVEGDGVPTNEDLNVTNPERRRLVTQWLRRNDLPGGAAAGAGDDGDGDGTEKAVKKKKKKKKAAAAAGPSSSGGGQ